MARVEVRLEPARSPERTVDREGCERPGRDAKLADNRRLTVDHL